MIVALMKRSDKKIVLKNDILQVLKSKFNGQAVEQALDRLLEDGMIYMGHNNDTFILEE
jgi:hypothetical protein